MSANGSPLHMVTISVSDLEKSLSFYRDILGMEIQSESELAGEAFEHHWKVSPGTTARAVLLQASGMDVGQVLLLQFSPASGVSSK